MSKHKEMRTRLGWKISYKSRYFVHPSLEFVPLFTGIRERSINEFLLFLCRQFSDVVRQTTLEKYIPVCMRACSILSSAKITVIEHINKATDFKRLGVGRANVGIFTLSFYLTSFQPKRPFIGLFLRTYV